MGLLAPYSLNLKLEGSLAAVVIAAVILAVLVIDLSLAARTIQKRTRTGVRLVRGTTVATAASQWLVHGCEWGGGSVSIPWPGIAAGVSAIYCSAKVSAPMLTAGEKIRHDIEESYTWLV